MQNLSWQFAASSSGAARVWLGMRRWRIRTGPPPPTRPPRHDILMGGRVGVRAGAAF